MHGSETLTLKLGRIGQTHYVPTFSQNSDLFPRQIKEHIQIEDVHPTTSQDADLPESLQDAAFPEVKDQECVNIEDVQSTSLQDTD